jgi:hypothetical protein
MLHPPFLEQSMVQVDPGLQKVAHPAEGLLQSTSQMELEAQSVLQLPAAQENEQVLPGELQLKSQLEVRLAWGLGSQAQLCPVQEQMALGWNWFEHKAPFPMALLPPPPCAVVPPDLETPPDAVIPA